MSFDGFYLAIILIENGQNRVEMYNNIFFNNFPQIKSLMRLLYI